MYGEGFDQIVGLWVSVSYDLAALPDACGEHGSSRAL